jgi:hypothetical protein
MRFEVLGEIRIKFQVEVEADSEDAAEVIIQNRPVESFVEPTGYSSPTFDVFSVTRI